MTIGTVVTFAGVSSTTIPELLITRVRRPLRGEIRDDVVQVPGREGFWLFEEEPGQRMITLSMSILGDDYESRREAVIATADWLDQTGLQRLIVDDEPDRFHLAKLRVAPDPDEWLDHASFEVDLIAEPYSSAIAISEENLALDDDDPETFTAPDKVTGIPVIEVTPRGGGLDGFELDLNAEVIEYGATIAENATITISTISFTVTLGANEDITLDGFFNPANLSMATVSGDFPVIVPGSNSISVEFGSGSTATSVDVDIYWRRRSR
jgi:predicted phage tail component-like protein